MHNRTYKLKSENVLKYYLLAEKGVKQVKKSEKRAMNKYRRNLEKQAVRKIKGGMRYDD